MTSETALSAAYERHVQAVADALHEDCRLEWQAIAVVDPGRAVTQHMADAHYGKAHDLTRRLWPFLDAARSQPATDGLREAAREVVTHWFDWLDGEADQTLRRAML